MAICLTRWRRTCPSCTNCSLVIILRFLGRPTGPRVGSLFLQLFALITPLLTQVIIDKVLVHQGWSTLHVLVFGLVVISIFKVVRRAGDSVARVQLVLRRSEGMKSFEFKTKRAFVAALALTGTVLAILGLVVIAGAGEKCAGRQWSEGYRILDFFSLSLLAVICAGMIGRVALGSRLWRGTYEKVDGAIIKFEDKAYGSVLATLVGLVVVLGVAIFQGYTVLIECRRVF